MNKKLTRIVLPVSVAVSFSLVSIPNAFGFSFTKQQITSLGTSAQSGITNQTTSLADSHTLGSGSSISIGHTFGTGSSVTNGTSVGTNSGVTNTTNTGTSWTHSIGNGSSTTTGNNHAQGTSWTASAIFSSSKGVFGGDNSKKSITVNGKTTSSPTGVVFNNTTYMPIWYVQQALTILGVPNQWNGSVWDLSSKSYASKNHVLPPKNEQGIEINDTSLQVVSGKVFQNTTYMPIWYVMQELNKIGIKSTWNGTTWGLTKG